MGMEFFERLSNVFKVKFLYFFGSGLINFCKEADISHKWLHLLEGNPPNEGIIHVFHSHKVGVFSHFQQSCKSIKSPYSVIFACWFFVAFFKQMQRFGAQCALDAILWKKLLILFTDPSMVTNFAPVELVQDCAIIELQICLKLVEPINYELSFRLCCD